MPETERDPGVRAFWSGTISFGLVAIPVHLLAGTRGRDTSLRTLAPDGTPLAREYVCPADGEVLEREDIVRGFPLGDDAFVVVSDEELEALEPERSRDIDLRRFVARDAIDPAFFDRAYLLAPDGSSTKAYRLLADVMEETGQAGVATFVMRGREHLVAILAEGGVLRAVTLRFADELREPDQAGLPVEGKAPAATRRRMEQAIDALAQDAIPAGVLTDEPAAALRAIAQQKLERGEDVIELGEEVAAAPEEEPVDIVAALRRSLRAGGRGDPRRSPPRGAIGAAGDLAGHSKQELYERAKALDIPGRSKMTKDELIAALQGR